MIVFEEKGFIGMPIKKYETSALLKPIQFAAAILIAIGTPVLQALKIYFFFCELIATKVITLAEILPKKTTVLKKSLPKVDLKLQSRGYKLQKKVNSYKPFVKSHLINILKGFENQKSELFIKSKHQQVVYYEKFQTLQANLHKIHLNLKNAKKINRRRIHARPIEKDSPVLPVFVSPKITLPTLPAISLPHILWPKFKLSKFKVPKLPKLLGAGTAAISFSVILFLIGYFSLFVLNDLPHPKLLAQNHIPLTTKIYDRNNVLLYQFHGDQNRTLVKLNELPHYVPEAIIAAEDKNFYRHLGFDPSGITRAAIANYSGTSSQGGSTITQQLVKFSLLSPERTITRKLRELILSLWTERLYTKDQILTMYINYIGFGGPAYGIEAASEIYFGKSAKNLSLSEASLLAALPSAPTTYSPFGRNPEIAKYRQKQVLDKMHEQGYITKKEAEDAKNAKLTFVPNETEIKAPHFVMYVKDELIKEFGEKEVLEGGLQVKTSLDYNLYKEITDMVKLGVEKQQYLNVQNGAALVTNPKTGEILAMAGSIDFFDLTSDGNVNVTVSERSPGSSIKPLTYALAFENNLLTPNTIIEDRPTEFRQVGGPTYRPLNYDNRFHGRMTARTALASSYNIPAVKVLERLGVINFLQFATNAGLTTLDDPNRFGLSITLGGGEVKMTDMAVAYSMFPNQGTKMPLKAVLEVKDSSGTSLEVSGFPETSERLISPRSAFFINSILSDDGARAPTFGRGSYLNIPGHTVAVKTGTTETKRDNWTIGYSFGSEPRLVAVWVGNNDNSPMSQYLESGNTGAAAIWNPVMQTALKNQSDSPVPKPEDLIAVPICPLTGTLPCENCPGIVTEYFVKGTEPKIACNLSKEDLEKFKNPEKRD